MNRPYIICHMVTSIDGKVTGEFLNKTECEKATDIYYEINRDLKCNGFICGRVTMEQSFTQGWYPEIEKYPPTDSKGDYVIDKKDMSGFYAVAFDPKGKLGWKSNKIEDDDPGYDEAQVIEVVTEQADPRYLSYLKSLEIPYIFAGKEEIDVNLALAKLKNAFGIKELLLEGGGVINGSFQRADAIDELSLVVAPITATATDKSLFDNGEMQNFELKKSKTEDGVLIVNYARNRMDKKELVEIIDDTIKDIWKNEIAEDYNNGWLLKEDTLKNSFYYHLRKRLNDIFEENQIRIFTEFRDDKFRGTKNIPDMVIAQVDFWKDTGTNYYGDDIDECLCVIEFKYKGGYNSANAIFDDYKKMQRYVEDLGVDSKLYMATIWEYEDNPTNWERKNSAWAKNRLTELNASYKRGTEDMNFYIVAHIEKKLK